ncbi:hypothetical protein LINPERPRIM_LOCUS28651 [Linum perenne]
MFGIQPNSNTSYNHLVIVNTSGNICDGRAGTMICSSPIVAEARAMLEAVALASTYPASSTVFSDCLNLVSCLKGPPCLWPWECYGLLDRITSALRASPNTKVPFIQRKHNNLADWVARSARESLLPPIWIHTIPVFPSEPG